MKKIVINVILIILLIGYFIYSAYYKLAAFRNSIYGVMIDIFVISSIILYTTFKFDKPLVGKLINVIYVLIFIIFKFISIGKMIYIILMLYSFVNIGYSIYIYFKTKLSYKSMYLVGCISYLQSVSIVLRVTFLKELPFWLPSLIFALTLLLITILYLFNQYKKYKIKENIISLPLCALFLGFCFSFLTLSSLNVNLDNSIPKEEKFLIIDKNISRGWNNSRATGSNLSFE